MRVTLRTHIIIFADAESLDNTQEYVEEFHKDNNEMPGRAEVA